MVRGITAWFGRLTLNTRVMLVMGVVILGLASMSVVAALESREQQMTGLAGSLRKQAEGAAAVFDSYRARVDKGELSEAEARKQAFRDVQAMRWDGGSGYLFGFDSNLILQLHPLRAELVGKSIHDEADAKGFHHYQAMLAADLKNGSGLTRYSQVMPKTGLAKDKISYSLWYKPWDLHMVTGAYFDDLNAAFERQLTASLLHAGVIALIVMLLVWLSMRSIRQTIGGEPRAAVALATRIAAGDLRRDEDDFAPGSLLEALQRMRERLATIVADVQDGSQVVAHAASQLTESSDNLSQRTQEQAAAIEESAAAMEEMTATVKQNAQNATQADHLSRGARQEAERGGEIVALTMTAMADISESSHKIIDIVNLIDEIAFQTNLLALNASIEAARAGEHGRGFAVVAAEVRRLAHSSASASRSIKTLIEESGQRVTTGRELVAQSAQALAAIVASVKKVTDIVAEVAAASHEQSAGVDQVNLAIAQIDEVTQQNAALVEEAAAVAKTMESQASSLSETTAQFRLDEAAPVAVVADERRESRYVLGMPSFA